MMTTSEKIVLLRRELADLERQEAFETLPLTDDEREAHKLLAEAEFPRDYETQRCFIATDRGAWKLAHRVRDSSYNSWSGNTLVEAAQKAIKELEEKRAKAAEAEAKWLVDQLPEA